MARLGNKIKIIDYDSMILVIVCQETGHKFIQVHIIHVSNSNYTTYQNDT